MRARDKGISAVFSSFVIILLHNHVVIIMIIISNVPYLYKYYVPVLISPRLPTFSIFVL